VVMQRTATPLTPVRFRPAPPITDPHGRWSDRLSSMSSFQQKDK